MLPGIVKKTIADILPSYILRFTVRFVLDIGMEDSSLQHEAKPSRGTQL